MPCGRFWSSVKRFIRLLIPPLTVFLITVVIVFQNWSVQYQEREQRYKLSNGCFIDVLCMQTPEPLGLSFHLYFLYVSISLSSYEFYTSNIFSVHALEYANDNVRGGGRADFAYF